MLPFKSLLLNRQLSQNLLFVSFAGKRRILHHSSESVRNGRAPWFHRKLYRRFPGTLQRTRNHGALHGTYRRIADFAIVFRADMPSARFKEPRGNSRWRASVLFGGDLCTVSSRAGLALNTFSIRSCLKYSTLKDRAISTADRITKHTMQ